MSWQHIDREAGTWTIPGEQMKNERSLALKLTLVEREILERRYIRKSRQKGDSQFVFPGNGKRDHYVEPKKAWNAFLKRANISNLHMHDLRRSLASGMARTGAELGVIKIALNHKDIKTTMDVCTKTAKDAEMEALQKAHDFIFSHGKIDQSRDHQ